jgi:hypothetical protein
MYAYVCIYFIMKRHSNPLRQPISSKMVEETYLTISDNIIFYRDDCNDIMILIWTNQSFNFDWTSHAYRENYEIHHDKIANFADHDRTTLILVCTGRTCSICYCPTIRFTPNGQNLLNILRNEWTHIFFGHNTFI